MGQQAHSQAEASQYHMDLDVRNPDFDACEHQRCRPACAMISPFVVPDLKSKVSRSDISEFSGLQHA